MLSEGEEEEKENKEEKGEEVAEEQTNELSCFRCLKSESSLGGEGEGKGKERKQGIKHVAR